MKKRALFMMSAFIATVFGGCQDGTTFYSNVLRSDVYYQVYSISKVDFLLVVDNSLTMSPRRGILEYLTQDFINVLTSRKAVDYQVAVTTVDLFTDGCDLVNDGTGTRVVKSLTDPNPVATLVNIFNNVTDSEGTSFWEQGLECAYQAIKNDVNINKELVRPNVPLAIAFFSDEEDYSCKSNCSGNEPENNPGWTPHPLSRYIDYFSGLKKSENTIVAMYPVVALDFADCSVSSLGTRYVTVADAVTAAYEPGKTAQSGSVCGEIPTAAPTGNITNASNLVVATSTITTADVSNGSKLLIVPSVATTGNVTDGNNVIVVASAAGVTPGMGVGGNGIDANSKVVSVVGNDVTLNNTAIGNETGTAITFVSASAADVRTGMAVLGSGMAAGTRVTLIDWPNITVNNNATATVGAASLTFVVAPATSITVGMTAFGNGIPLGTTVTAVSLPNVSLSKNATATATDRQLTFVNPTNVSSTILQDSFTKIAQNVADRGLVFKLSSVASGAGINVFVNSELIPYSSGLWEYDATTNSVTFVGSYAPPLNAVVEVTYSQDVI